MTGSIGLSQIRKKKAMHSGCECLALFFIVSIHQYDGLGLLTRLQLFFYNFS